MSDDEEVEEYEVESITCARVDVEKARGKKNLLWKYNVRWKGYGPGDDTWESVKSFVGSEHIIERFWERANAGDRDYRDISLFKVGEEFLPTGPPRRKPKRKSLKPSNAAPSPTSPGQSSAQARASAESPNEKRRRSPSVIEIEDSEDDRPRKRVRETSKYDKLSEPMKQPIPLPGRGKKDVPKNATSLPRPTHTTPRRSARSPSFDEIIPASDEELEPQGQLNAPPQMRTVLAVDADTLEPFGGDNEHADDPTTVDNPILDVDMVQDSSSPPNAPDPLFDDMEQSQNSDMPFHRAKAANPRVKMVDGPKLADMEGAIPVKARLLGQSVEAPSASDSPRIPSNRATHASGSKPGPGRSSSGFMKKNTSSLLTFEKGALKTVKGRYHREPQQKNKEAPESNGSADFTPGSLQGNEETLGGEIPGFSTFSAQAPPTAEELLHLAGADQAKEALSDFEDDVPTAAQPVPKPTSHPDPDMHAEPTSAPVAEPQLDQTSLQQSLALARDKLFPSVATTGVMNTFSAAWKRSTIFGPLGLGSDSQTKPALEPSTSGSVESSPFFLNLDTSASIPVVLADQSPLPPGSPTLAFIVSKKGPPGKFYSQKSSLALLDTFRTGGPSAKIVPDANATADQIKQFEHFRSRLSSGELFVAMAGVDVLAFCSSDNALLSQRLNISPLLLGQPGSVLVTRVIIENFSAYAEAVDAAMAVV